MRTLAIAVLTTLMAGCATLPSQTARSAALEAPTRIEVVRVARPRASQQQLLAAYWAERAERRGRGDFTPPALASRRSFPETGDSDDQGWQETIRLVRESAAARAALRDSIQQSAKNR